MKWFEGSIPAAIQQAKEKKVVFVVYITGEDEESKKMNESWESEIVEAACAPDTPISLKLQADSQECKQFGQFYPVVVIPCTFFIGENGVPLEATGGAVEPEKLVEAINKAKQLHQAQIESLSAAAPPESTAASPQAQPPAAAEPLQPEPSGSAESATTPTEATPQSLTPTAPSVGTSSDGASASGPPDSKKPCLEDQVQRSSREHDVAKAQEIIAQKAAEKAKKEKEDERKREIERRKMGQQVGKFAHWKAEQEAKETREQLKKEKEEEKIARERVRQEIAKDRAERAARYKKEKEDRETVQQERETAKLAAASAVTAEEQAKRMETARIQFRLPDGSSSVVNLHSSQTLRDAENKVAELTGARFGNMTLVCSYPRRIYTESDRSQTLLDLGLAPSAVIMVLPERSANSTSSGSSSGESFFWMLLAPFVAIWNFIYNMLFATVPQPAIPPTEPATASTGPSVTSTQTGRGARPKSSYGVRNRTRQDGNMHRLRGDDDDDDMTVYNGNSTQQM